MLRSILSNLKLSFKTGNIYYRETYSTNAEDILINTLLKNSSSGFYLDIGAHHPFRFSNTYLLYEAGWSGINIDASKDSIDLLKQYRRRDINLHYVVSDKKEDLDLFTNSLGALNTINKDVYAESKEKYDKSVQVTTTPIHVILDGHLPKNKTIDFMNIDVEGNDFNVLKSFPWEKYKPSLICVEDNDFNVDACEQSEIYSFLIRKKYKLKAFIPNTLFFIQNVR